MEISMAKQKSKIRSIITTRDDTYSTTFQLYHEWEDVFSENLNLPFVPYTLQNMTYLSKNTDGFDLAFISEFKHIECYRPNLRTIPILIDCWKEDTYRFEELCCDFPLVYVSCLEAYNDIISQGFGKKLLYMPLSIADKQLCKTFPQKQIDVIQYGRRNPVLDYWMQKYLLKYPKVSYVTTCLDNSGKIKLISNIDGVIGDCTDRQGLMNAVSMSKVSLVSSPGMDNSRDTGGYNVVSQRFYEGAAKYCYMLGRYPKNKEFICCGVENICDCVDDYEQFECRLNYMLANQFDQFDAYNKFLRMNVTSCRVATLLRDTTLWL